MLLSSTLEMLLPSLYLVASPRTLEEPQQLPMSTSLSSMRISNINNSCCIIEPFLIETAPGIVITANLAPPSAKRLISVFRLSVGSALGK